MPETRVIILWRGAGARTMLTVYPLESGWLPGVAPGDQVQVERDGDWVRFFKFGVGLVASAPADETTIAFLDNGRQHLTCVARDLDVVLGLGVEVPVSEETRTPPPATDQSDAPPTGEVTEGFGRTGLLIGFGAAAILNLVLIFIPLVTSMFATMDLGYAEKLPPCDALYGSFSGGGQPCDEYAGNELAIWTAVVFLAHGAITVVLGAVGPRGVLVAWVTAPGTWLLAIMALQSLAAALIPFVVWVLVPAAIPPLGASLIPALSGRTGSRGTFG